MRVFFINEHGGKIKKNEDKKALNVINYGFFPNRKDGRKSFFFSCFLEENFGLLILKRL